MSPRSESQARILLICGLTMAAVAVSSALLGVLGSLGVLGLGPDIRWIDWVVVPKRMAHLPIEVYLAGLAAALVWLRRSQWALVVAVLVLGVAAGFVARFMLSPELWVFVIGGALALMVSGASVNDGGRRFMVDLAREVATLWSSPLSRWQAVAVISVVAFAGVGLQSFVVRNSTEDAQTNRMLAWYQAAKAAVHAPPGIELVIFSDYQCPSCRVAVPQLLASAAGASGRTAKVTIRDFPLDNSCNDVVPAGVPSLHPSACVAAIAARLVDERLPDEAEAFHRWLYSNQDRFSEQFIRRKLSELGIGDQFDASWDRLLLAVRADIREGASYGVFSTPSVVLNRVKLPNISAQGLEKLIAYEMTGRATSPTQRSSSE